MSLERAVAAPFRTRGTEQMPASEFVVDLSLDRDWFSPDQAKRLVDVAASEGLLELEDDDLRATFDPLDVDIPSEFEPDESILLRRSTFERMLATVVGEGVDKQTAVADINRLQAELDITIEAAAALYSHRGGHDVTGLSRQAQEDL